MEEQPSDEGELPGPPSEAEGDEADGGSPVDEARGGPEAAALAMEAEEIRRMIAAGAGSPEAIRELAARLREHRAREEALWRAEVKPALVKEGKGRLRGHAKPTLPPSPAPLEPQTSTSNALVLGLVLLGLVLVVVIAAETSVWVLIAPVVALLVWAWYQGRDATR